VKFKYRIRSIEVRTEGTFKGEIHCHMEGTNDEFIFTPRSKKDWRYTLQYRIHNNEFPRLEAVEMYKVEEFAMETIMDYFKTLIRT